MDRRCFLKLLGAAAGAIVVPELTPRRVWQVPRSAPVASRFDRAPVIARSLPNAAALQRAVEAGFIKPVDPAAFERFRSRLHAAERAFVVSATQQHFRLVGASQVQTSDDGVTWRTVRAG